MASGRPAPGRGATLDIDEDVVVRQYRYLLTTATVDALEGIHVEVLCGMPEGDRRMVLEALCDAFATGLHVGSDQVAKVAHLVAVGAHRAPRAWLASLDPAFARALAQEVLETEASFGRFNGYAQWDGVSPEPVEEAGPNDGFDPNANRRRIDLDPRLRSFRGFSGLGGYP
ncbi:hypothetical protein ABEG17_05620 [Pedococcus sp. KACC 23699]|uniref:Uncharacterized protein n=1 Tax=Pedococcus sp. KACC 23699 TaxID=3149228 RepID=A0AAU7JWN3_9MICO